MIGYYIEPIKFIRGKFYTIRIVKMVDGRWVKTGHNIGYSCLKDGNLLRKCKWLDNRGYYYIDHLVQDGE